MLENIALFAGLTQKMGYLQTRQRVLSQNITNNDTPGYQAMEVKAPDFRKTMAAYNGGVTLQASGDKLGMATTSGEHMDMKQMGARPVPTHKDKQTYDITPSGNSVSMEEQMMSASQNAMDYQLMTNLYNKSLDMMRASIRG